MTPKPSPPRSLFDEVCDILNRAARDRDPHRTMRYSDSRPLPE